MRFSRWLLAASMLVPIAAQATTPSEDALARQIGPYVWTNALADYLDAKLSSNGVIQTLAPNAVDDTASFAAALKAIQASPVGGTLYPAPGDYHISANLALTLGARQRFTFRSDGPHAVRIYWTNAAGLAVTLAPVSVWLPSGPSVAVQDIDFIASWPGLIQGTALSITQLDPSGGNSVRNPTPSVYLSRLSFEANTGDAAWLKGASLFGMNITRVENISYVGVTGDATSTALSYDTDTANTIMVDHTIVAPFALHAGTAIKIGAAATSNKLQGFDVIRPSFTGGAIGIDYECSGVGDCDQLNVSGGQINTTGPGILAVNVSTVKVNGVYLIGSATETTGYINITGGQGHSIQASKLASSGGASELAIVLNNVAGTAVLPGAIISGDQFSSSGHSPISLTGTTDYVLVGLNQASFQPLLANASSGTHNYELMTSTGPDININNGTGNVIPALSSGIMINGDGNTVSSTLNPKNITIIGGGNIVTGPNSLIVGFQNTSTATLGTSMFGRRLADNGWNGCTFSGYQSAGSSGGTEHFRCTWQQLTSSIAQVRVTADGAACSIGAHNCLNPAANSILAMSITIAMSNTITLANSGSWSMPLGQLREGATVADTVWTPGTTIALGTAFTVGTAADTSKGGFDLELTPPSAQASVFTVTFDGTIAR